LAELVENRVQGFEDSGVQALEPLDLVELLKRLSFESRIVKL
jgi:hypothetical protein